MSACTSAEGLTGGTVEGAVDGGLPCCCRLALLAERVELDLPLPGLVYQIGVFAE